MAIKTDCATSSMRGKCIALKGCEIEIPDSQLPVIKITGKESEIETIVEGLSSIFPIVSTTSNLKSHEKLSFHRFVIIQANPFEEKRAL